MMGVEAPETCWATHKRQVINLWNCCIWLVNLFVLHMFCLKRFSYILQVFVWNILWCTVSNFYHAHDISIIYCSSGSFLFVYLSCWMAAYVYNGINIYGVRTNNGYTRQYRNAIVCVGCTERMLFFCLCCVVPVSMYYTLYLVTVWKYCKMGDLSDVQKVGLLVHI
jgi:hypothetical protein